MKEYLSSLLCVAVVSTAWAQCPATKTVCVPEPTTVKKTKVLFSSECATVCLKGCPFLKKGGDCNSCKDGSCGRSHVERYLYKRVQTEICESHKCVPIQVPACASGKCCASSAAAPGASAAALPIADASKAPAEQTIVIVPPPETASPTPIRARLP
jgi:hypothetical protein